MLTEVLWSPKQPDLTNMWHFMDFIAHKYDLSFTDYQSFHQWSVQHMELFWPALADYFSIDFDKPAKKIIEYPENLIKTKWFRGARLNFAKNLLKLDGPKAAISAIDEKGSTKNLSYHQLKEEVAAFAAGLKNAGISKGDRVAAIMPNNAETIIAMLASASLGAIWASCSPEFGASALIDRLGQIEPKLLLIADGYYYAGKEYNLSEKLVQIIEEISSIEHIVIAPVIHHPKKTKANKEKLVYLWDEFVVHGSPLSFVSLPFDHPLYILFSSGTTGKPKCITHSVGGTLLQHVKELGLHTDIKPQDNLFFYTTCGWMMWNWMVSTLALGAKITLYDGSPMYPEATRLLDLIEQEQITVFGTSAKYISSLEKSNRLDEISYSLDSLRCILSTGSPLLPKNYDFIYQKIKADLQLCSISGGTDIISCFGLGNAMLPVYRGELQCIGLGMDVAIFDEQGQSQTHQPGELVCKNPFPSMPIYFWNDPYKKKYKAAYFKRFKNVWAHGDYAEITPNHGLVIHGRADTVLNPGGVRIGTAEIYRQVEKIPEIVDAAVIGQHWEDDERIILFVTLQPGILMSNSLKEKISTMIRNHASPRHVPAKIIKVDDIPKTINGKTVEIAIKKTIHGEPVSNMGSIANPDSLQQFKGIYELQL